MHKRFFSLTATFVVGLLVASSAFGQTKEKFRRVINAIPGQYIVVFNNQMARSDVAPASHALARAHRGKVKFVYEDALKGFAVKLSEAAAIALSKNPQVDYVEEETLNTIAQTQQSLSPGPSDFYGIDRVDQRDLPLNNIYSYFQGGCCPSNVFILDTGMPISTGQWPGSQAFIPPLVRVHNAYDTFGGNGLDFNNHGSSVASIIGGVTYGVAKNAELYTVKVCDDSGGCQTSNAIAGLNWVIANHQGTAVVNMSLGGFPSSSLDTAVRNAEASNLIVVVAAGNDNDNASSHSPSRVVEALTVGATLNNDARASYSNFGGVVDLYAPGGDVPTQGIPTVASAGGTRPFDGTSAAAPHAAGVAALYLSFNPGVSSYVAAGELKKGSTWNKVTNLPYAGPDNLLYSLFPMSVSHFSGSIPFYRYYSGVNTDHFYTTNWSELGPTAYSWDFEFVGCYIFGSQVSNTVPLYQYYNGGTRDHFYTTNFSTLGNGAYGYVYEKVAGYVYSSNVSGSLPLYRYYNATIGDHFYTTDFNELGNGIKGYVYEAIECYVSP
ncbi:MAG TPA: S8 family serine peptidase [Pyrinomonadaceae bacterium]|jgi:hypothetical protein